MENQREVQGEQMEPKQEPTRQLYLVHKFSLEPRNMGSSSNKWRIMTFPPTSYPCIFSIKSHIHYLLNSLQI